MLFPTVLAWIAAPTVFLFQAAQAPTDYTSIRDDPQGEVFFETSSAEWSWSPDGAEIVFDRSIGTISQLRIVHLDSGTIRSVTSGDHHDSQPSWVGERICFVRAEGDGSGIIERDLTSGQERVLTGATEHAEYPALSPDGRRVAYVRRSSTDRRRRLAVVIDLSTSVDVVVFDSPFGLNNLSWDPGGSEVLLYSVSDDGWNDIYAARADGSGIRRITDNTVTDSYSAEVSPDGARLLFGQGAEASPYHRWFNYDLFEKNLVTGLIRRLTWSYLPDDRAHYSPDGQTIGFTSRRSGYPELYVMGADGRSIQTLTNQPPSELTGLIRRDGLGAAEALFDRAREDNPNAKLMSDRAAAVLTTQFLAAENYDAALRVAQMSAAMHPESPTSRTNLAQVLIDRDDVEAAEAELCASLRIQPNQPAIVALLGRTGFLGLLDSIDGIYTSKGLDVFDLTGHLIQRGDPLTSIRLLLRLNREHPNDRDILGRLAHVQLMLGDPEMARTAYDAVLDIDPDNSLGLFHSARLENGPSQTHHEASNARVANDSAPSKARPRGLAWAEVIDDLADPAIIEDPELRHQIAKSRLPWRVRDRETGIEMLLVLPGTYLRGAATDDPYDRANERPLHQVTLSQPFYLGRFEVSNAEFRRQVPGHDSGPFPRDPTISLDLEDHPAVQISWEEADAFARGFGLRLPSEAEWEYAARAGVKTRYPWGNDIEKGQGFGNVFNDAVKERLPEMDWEAFAWDDGWIGTSPAGAFTPNRWGFHDLCGNVWEYVADSFDDSLYADIVTPVRDPLHDAGPTTKRTLRGGGFGNAPRGSGIPYRYGMPPDSRHFGNGFRVARWP